jgi:CBS domain-containing protein
MWEHDLGALPVLDGRGDAIAMVTDRDLCMASYTQGKPLRDILVSAAASHSLCSVRPDDSIGVAEAVMKMYRVTRVPVVDRGGTLTGIIAVADLVRHASFARGPRHALHPEAVAETLAAVYRPHDLQRHPLEPRHTMAESLHGADLGGTR